MRFGFDTNLFVYSFDKSDPIKHDRARPLVSKLLDQNTAVPLQVILETLNAAHRKRHLSAPEARAACAALAEIMSVEPATPADALAASALAEQHRLQFFDALMVIVHQRLGATVLLSEDLQDGRRFDVLQIVNPFVPANESMLTALLTPAPGTA